jgi:hypothetical protein
MVAAIVPCEGRNFMPFNCDGSLTARFEWMVRGRAAGRILDEEGELARGEDREAARLIAGVRPGEVGDAVARHVVMVRGLAELLRREELHLPHRVPS